MLEINSFSNLSKGVSDYFFANEISSAPVKLKKISEKSQILWLNERLLKNDPNFLKCGQNKEAYKRYLLEKCAFITAKQEFDEIGWADRYGGIGIGMNGGSGRAVLLNGYNIKGVGKTELIGVGTDEHHASGGAYLEEAMRETIFSEIIDQRYPHGAVSTIAIIDTGINHDWPEDISDIPSERRVLIIRPSFLRPAHFERAFLHRADNKKVGYIDTQRVKNNIEKLIEFGDLKEIYSNLFLNWSEQLAFSLASRLSHGADTSSNITLDGKIVDFGSSSALPGWYSVTIAENMTTTGFELLPLQNIILSIFYYLERYTDGSFNAPKILDRLFREIFEKYNYLFGLEFLKRCGVDEGDISKTNYDMNNLLNVIMPVYRYYARERIFLTNDYIPPKVKWDFGNLWDDIPPRHLRDLRKQLDGIVTHQIKNFKERSEVFRKIMHDFNLRVLSKRIHENINKHQDAHLNVDANIIEYIISHEVRSYLNGT